MFASKRGMAIIRGWAILVDYQLSCPFSSICAERFPRAQPMSSGILILLCCVHDCIQNSIRRTLTSSRNAAERCETLIIFLSKNRLMPSRQSFFFLVAILNTEILIKIHFRGDQNRKKLYERPGEVNMCLSLMGRLCTHNQ